MAKFGVLPHDMKLYSPSEPDGRVFPAGEQWPGDAWSDRPGGDDVGKGTAKAALKDLEEAQKQAEALRALIASGEHDRAQLAGELASAKTEIADLKQTAADAEAARAAAAQEAAEAVATRDQGTALEAQLRARIADLETQIAAFDGDGDGKAGGSKPKKGE